MNGYNKCINGEIWWCLIGKDIEIGKTKPVLVLKSFNTKMFFGIPLTSSDSHNKKSLGKYHSPIRVNNINSFVTLGQLRLFDTKRLLRKLSKIDKDSLSKITDSLFNVI